MIKTMYVFIGLALVAAFVSIFLSNYASVPIEPAAPAPEPVAIMCTADALECPDGSYVGRTGVDCSFVCPAENKNDSSDLITVSVPKPFSVIASPLAISGQAKGSWYFEASFEVELQNNQGIVIAKGVATATADWMTTEFVPFAATLQFINPYTSGQTDDVKNGILVFKKANPSGEPQNDNVMKVKVRFAP